MVNIIWIKSMWVQQLRLRSEPKTLEFKYLMAQEKIDLQRELQKELKLMKETQSGFNLYLSLFVGAIICGLRHLIIFDWNVNFGIKQKDYVCRSKWLVPKLIFAEVNEIFCTEVLVPKFTRAEVRLPAICNNLVSQFTCKTLYFAWLRALVSKPT